MASEPNSIKSPSLRDLLLIHELIFVVLIILAVAAGIYGIQLWDKSSRESARINQLVQEVQLTRGDLYRQMKELFDAFFLHDEDGMDEYKAYTTSILKHFDRLNSLAVGTEEKRAIADLEKNYRVFAKDAPELFLRYQAIPNEKSRKALYDDIETGIFGHYEAVSKRAEDLLTLKQEELKSRLEDAKKTSIAVLSIPILLAGLLLVLSRTFLKHAIVNPIKAMSSAATEISTGNLQHKVPEKGASELATLSREINKMAEDLSESRTALIQSEKQAAQGSLVPMLAHNIRNPLASIRATAQVADDKKLNRDTREALQGIITTVDRLERWTGSLLAYLHPLKPQLSETKVRQVIDGALVPAQQKIREKSIDLELPDWDKVDDRITTDQHLLEQALYNLIQNAIEASASGSKIEIHADIGEDFLNLMIADRGSGMPFTPEPSALSPGPSTKRFGTGLGIPFAFKVCEALGGSISFEPRQGGGTLIEISLPRHT